MQASDLPVLHEKALADTRRYVAGVKDGQWRDPTPCTEWDVRALLNHIVSENMWVAPLVAGQSVEEIGDRFEGDVLGEDPLASYEASAADAARAFNSPGAMGASCAVSYGPVPGEVFAGHRLIDVVVHGWDLAKATGQDTSLEGALIEACLSIAEPQAQLLRASGMFGGDVEVPPGADDQTRLLALLGRRP